MNINQLKIDLEQAEQRVMALSAVAKYQRLPFGLRKIAKEQSRQFLGLARLIRQQLSKASGCESI